ncbi:MAG: DUF3501 family protein [Rhodospirillaceae bacterium]|nr:DUF3501 family protein [Rhodospirillaceae bacterium]MBT3927120.1 DUF3501 family protein [Rhodospirillaceae bacterium]MBT4428281.1 DUF3501 family protein [Rhodospirillaceae bacterium]MBT6831315.1 DUF3501 family protein [Rhodospirillaceae bacterium]MBT7294338.1 DUF3501 family protein [Rhodospirillaceae bacterium]
MPEKHEILPADIMEMAAYGEIRAARRSEISLQKRIRRLAVGPFATFYFENYDTMWMQIHEMLFVEKGGTEQIAGELEAYNPLIPKGRELIATLMFEIPDAERRARELARLGGIEETICLELDDHAIAAVALQDNVERTTDAGKTSAVHFLRFPFTDSEVAKFRDPSVRALISLNHPNYGHMAVIAEEIRTTLSQDFD